MCVRNDTNTDRKWPLANYCVLRENDNQKTSWYFPSIDVSSFMETRLIAAIMDQMKLLKFS